MQENMTSEEPKRQRHIPNEVGQLSDAIGHLSGLIDELEKKFQGVLTVEPSEESEKKSEVASSVVPLATDIRELKWRIDSIVRVVESMHRRLEL